MPPVGAWIVVGSLGAILLATFWAMLREGRSDKRPWSSDSDPEPEDGAHGHGSSKSDTSHTSDSSSGGDGDD